MASDGLHISEYDPTLADAILGEAAHLLRNLGFSAQHAILIGGLVPGLLVLDPGPGRARHVGTADLDICLSVALIEGDTAEYERIEKALRAAGFEPHHSNFAWRRTKGRDKTKDAYDIVWLLENWQGGPEGAAVAVRATGLLNRDDVRKAMPRLATEFSAPDRLGPSSFVRFMAPAGAPQDERVRMARRAAGAVQAFIYALEQP